MRTLDSLTPLKRRRLVDLFSAFEPRHPSMQACGHCLRICIKLLYSLHFIRIGLGTVSMRYAFAAQTVPAAGTFPLRELFSDPGEIDGRKLR